MNDILKNKTLLYAEDSKSIQELYGRYFSNIFKSVKLANDGQEALNFYFDEKPDCVILDINMPKVDGIKIANIINKDNLNIPIILLTARSDKQTLKDAIELNILTYLEKPVSRNELYDAMQKLETVFANSKIKLWDFDNTSYYWDKEKNILFKDEEKVPFTKQEALLLKLLIDSNKISSYQDIYEYVWQNDDKEYNESTIKTIISTLKSKLPENTIKNERGVGYHISLD